MSRAAPPLSELETNACYANLLRKLAASARAAGDKRFAKQCDEEARTAERWLAYWAERLGPDGKPVEKAGEP